MLGITDPIGAISGVYRTLYREEQKGGITGFLAGMVPGEGIYKVAAGKESITSPEGALDVASDVLMFTPLGWVSRGLKLGAVAEKVGSKLIPKGVEFAAGKGTGELIRTGTKTGAESLGRLLPKANTQVAKKSLIYGGLGLAGVGAGYTVAQGQAQGQSQSPTYEPEKESQQDSTLLWALAGLAVLGIGYVLLRR